jgi:hypothetical protein
MTNHVRTQIRHRFRSVLVAALDDTYDIDASRKSKRNVTVGAFVNIVTANDQNAGRDTMGNAMRHVLSVYVRVQRTGSRAALDDTLDADEIAINGAIIAANWLDLTLDTPILVQSNSSSEADGERELTELVIRFDVEYLVNHNDLTTPIT